MQAGSRLLYLANIRMPTEKAHGLQIMQMCEAFTQAGAAVTLYAARRLNTPEMSRVSDPWAHYGVAHSFEIKRVPCLDLYGRLERLITVAPFVIQLLTYTLVLMVLMLARRADVYYSRDVTTLLALSLFKPRRTLIYEAHALSKSRFSHWMQTACVRRVGLVVAVTGKLAADLATPGAHIITAHDGYRSERFAGMPDRAAARASIPLFASLPPGAFVAGYVGRLHTMSMSKGVDTLVEAIAQAKDLPIYVCLVGGPDDMADALRSRWIELGLPPERFLYSSNVKSALVPAYLAAFDVCTMNLPWTEHFAYYASPLKLFEYMAAGGTILSSDLPAVSEVVKHDESAFLVPPGDVPALSDALRRLYADPALRARLGMEARRHAEAYTWRARAERILNTFQQDS